MGERYADIIDRMDSGTARYVRFGQRFSADRGTHMVLDLCVIGALVMGQGGVHTDSSTHAALLLLAGSVRRPRGQLIDVPCGQRNQCLGRNKPVQISKDYPCVHLTCQAHGDRAAPRRGRRDWQ